MNKAILHGNSGKDPEVKQIGETKVAKFSLATQSFRKDTEGNKVTDWHNIVAWGKLADLCEKYVKKGSSLIVEGEIQYRTYTDKDGVTKHITEIQANNIHFTSKKPESDSPKDNQGEWQKGKQPVKAMSDVNELPGTEEELPF